MRRGLLLAVSLALSLGVVELALRWVGGVGYRPLPPPVAQDEWSGLLHRPSSVPGLAYELAPGLSIWANGFLTRTNSYGMRGPEPQSASREDLIRVVAIGDSYTFGWGVRGQAAYPRVLERRLNRSGTAGRRFEVLNLGVSGYSARDEALVFEHKALAWNPHLAIVGYVLNDPMSEPRAPLQAAFNPPRWWQYSHLLRLGVHAWEGWRVRQIGDGLYLRYLHADTRRWEGVVEAYESMGRLARQHQIATLLVIFPIIPVPSASWDDYAYADLHGKVAALGRQHGFLVLDLLPIFAAVPPRAFDVEERNRHFHEGGHLLTADSIRTLIAARLPEIFAPDDLARLPGR